MFGQNGRVNNFGKPLYIKNKKQQTGRYGIDFFPELWKLTEGLQQPRRI